MKSIKNFIKSLSAKAWFVFGLAFAFAVFLGWREGIAIAFAYMSMVVAAYSIGISNRALKLTRATTRPFLNISHVDIIWAKEDEHSASVRYFMVGLCNTGVFPADQISVQMKVNKQGMDDQKHLFTVDETLPTICFPSGEISNLRFIETNEQEKIICIIDENLKARIEIDYINKLTQETHKTNCSYLAIYKPDTNPTPIPLPKEDFWI